MTTTRFEPATYRRSTLAFGLAAGLCLAVGAMIERPLLGVGLYAVGMAVAAALPYAVDVRLFDERDDRIHRRASGLTLALFGWLSALVYPSLVVPAGTEHFSWGPASAAVAWTTTVVYSVYLLAMGYYRTR
ncbi:DUF2178 domain-containing protein [Natronomonas salina]|uniref:DUF2178 domain-containing protein n=1 Tax=Natronomonas salina TaxID=1710540 RepID=UPI001BA894C3|nr:DUF2178 domain-containing protein [Natronomonas salina]